jgi:predicted RNA-binding protein with PUA-like domain
MNYWLMKSEPNCFSVDNLAEKPKQISGWDGVRNYQARNMMRDDMRVNDLAFFYHSSCDEPGIAGVMKIVRSAYPDLTALDPENEHYDPKSTLDNPRWYQVDVQLQRKFNHVITLSELRAHPLLTGLTLLKKGNRLSILPLSPEEWDIILVLEP